MLSGDNGILNKAEEAKDRWDITSKEEEGVLANTASIIDDTLQTINHAQDESELLSSYFNSYDDTILDGFELSNLGPNMNATDPEIWYYLYKGKIYQTVDYLTVEATDKDASKLGYNSKTGKITTINGEYTPDGHDEEVWFINGPYSYTYYYYSDGRFYRRIVH